MTGLEEGSQTVKGFEGHMISDATTQLCHVAQKQPQKYVIKWTWMCYIKISYMDTQI